MWVALELVTALPAPSLQAGMPRGVGNWGYPRKAVLDPAAVCQHRWEEP